MNRDECEYTEWRNDSPYWMMSESEWSRTFMSVTDKGKQQQADKDRKFPPAELNPQPTWPEGTAPDLITDIRMGFFDGNGEAHLVPDRGYTRCVKGGDGKWRWEA